MKNIIIHVIFAGLFLSSNLALADLHTESDIQEFIDEMVSKHSFDRDELVSVFSRAKVADSILEAISRPAEAMPWYKYRQIFIRNDRIRLGAEFIRDNADILADAEQQYGVPPEIIAAIIGVETRYGSNKGSYKVIDSLVTLGFRYPKRSSFFRGELEQFLLLARDQGLDPHSVKGSYAGAMGIPQFISSSYRHYAVDFDGDGHIDIWENPADAIGSVANYFKMHGWVAGEKITLPASVDGDAYVNTLTSSLEPEATYADLTRHGVSASNDDIGEQTRVKLLEYELENGKEYWLGLKNFYVITRYNHSALYAMAVYQLSREILAELGN